MERYVIKERRYGEEYPQGNQMIQISASSTIGNNITIPHLYYGASGDLPVVQNTVTGFVNANRNTPHFVPNNMLQTSGQIVSGIDPCYLAAYSTDTITSVAGPSAQMHQDQSMLPGNMSFGSNYQNCNPFFIEKIPTQRFSQQPYPQGAPVIDNLRFETQTCSNRGNNRSAIGPQRHSTPPVSDLSKGGNSQVPATTRKQSEVNLLKNEAQYQVRTRSEKLKIVL